jgi:hypothetical protein
VTEAEWLECVDCHDLIAEADSLFAGWQDTRTPRLLACAAYFGVMPSRSARS